MSFAFGAPAAEAESAGAAFSFGAPAAAEGGFAFAFGEAAPGEAKQEEGEAAPQAEERAAAREWTLDDAVRGATVMEHVRVNDMQFSKVNAACTGEVLGEVTAETDIVDGVYEGGLKLWECALDLVVFLRDRCSDDLAPGARVLELGCGHGLPGIYALQCGAQAVLADFNAEVLQHVTIPNVMINMREEWQGNARFFSGDWRAVAEALGPTFDLVLAADTIYTMAGTVSMWEAVKAALRPPAAAAAAAAEEEEEEGSQPDRGGLAVIAAKRYYFGTGGSVAHMTEIAEADGYEVELARTFEDGKSQIRDVLLIRKILS